MAPKPLYELLISPNSTTPIITRFRPLAHLLFASLESPFSYLDINLPQTQALKKTTTQPYQKQHDPSHCIYRNSKQNQGKRKEMGRLAPLSEEPINEEGSSDTSKKEKSWRKWLKNQFPPLFHKKSDLKILLGVLGCPLSPVSGLPKHPCNVSSDLNLS